MSSVLRLAALAFVLAPLAAPAVNAQARYPTAPGYVVTARGDTLRGELALLPSILASQEVRFHREGAAQPVRYGVLDLAAYGFEGGARYVRHALAPADDLDPMLLFLLPLVEGGELSLWAFDYDERSGPEAVWTQRSESSRFAVGDTTGRLRPLYQRTERVHSGGRASWQVDRQYVRALAVAFKGCPQEQDRLEQLALRQRDLVGAVLRYNACVGAPATATPAESARRRPDFQVGFGVRGQVGTYTVHMENVIVPEAFRLEGSAVSVRAQVLVRPVVISPGLTVPLEAFATAVRLGSDWSAPVYEASDFDRTRFGAALGVRQAAPLFGVETFVGVGVHSSWHSGEDFKTILFPLPHSGKHWVPRWSSGTYAEVGIAGRRLARGGLGLRYEGAKLGYVNPFVRERSNWQSRSLAGFALYRL